MAPPKTAKAVKSIPMVDIANRKESTTRTMRDNLLSSTLADGVTVGDSRSFVSIILDTNNAAQINTIILVMPVIIVRALIFVVPKLKVMKDKKVTKGSSKPRILRIAMLQTTTRINLEIVSLSIIKVTNRIAIQTELSVLAILNRMIGVLRLSATIHAINTNAHHITGGVAAVAMININLYASQ